MKTSFKYIVISILFFFHLNIANSQSHFKEKIEEIKFKLEAYSDSTLTGLNETVNFDIANAPIQEFLGLLATTHNLDISVSPSLKISVSYRFTNSKVKDVLLFLCKSHKLEIQFVNNILLFKSYKPPEEKPVLYTEKKLNINYQKNKDLLSVDLENDSLKLFVKQVSKVTNKNILLSNDLKNLCVSGFIHSVKLLDALEILAKTNNLTLKKENEILLFESNSQELPNPKKRTRVNNKKRKQSDYTNKSTEIYVDQKGNDTYITINAEQIPLVDLFNEISQLLKLNYFFFSLPDQVVTLHLENMIFDEVLSHILKPTDHTFTVSNGVYLIGKREMEGLRSSEIFKLKFRSVEEIDKVIPEKLKKDVQLSVFKELNAVILSGSAPQINEIKSFLKAIDEPVPNVLIEVLVVDVKKGYNIETGIQAILSDTTVSSKVSGAFLPGLDLTLGTDIISDIFKRANLVNLGKVTPRFYLNLKALENNNNINIRSTPKLATLNGHEAVLSIGQSVYFVQKTQVVTPGVNPITTVTEQFQEISADLNITINPIVSGNEHVTLSIDAEFSSFIPPEVAGAPPGSATRQFNSMIRVKNGEMIVLGGLEEVVKSETNSGVPLLSRIPILKWIFSSKSKGKNEDRLIVFIKPIIVF